MGRAPSVFVTCDVVVMTIRGGELNVLLIRRDRPPFRGRWALPGGFVEAGEGLQASALRELREETGVGDLFVEQLYTFGDPERDPRGRVITVAYMALVAESRLRPRAGSDARATAWFPVRRPPPLAFDHREILATALSRLRAKLSYTTVGFQLLPERFTLSELQGVYEIILGKTLDKRNFRKKILSLGLLRSHRTEVRGRHRPAQVYSFKVKEIMIIDGLIRA
ncbi:MAG TPA: NUDIX domain-containing protein [Planctomycetota bacterium]|nr:NUDIX domain-containing protein [Planctomycetota bacterium]